MELALRRGLSVDAGDRFPNMGALIDAIAPRRLRWKLPAAVGAGVVVVAILLTQCFPVHGGGSSEFVANARASCSGELAVLAARSGDVDGALGPLDALVNARVSEEVSRELAVASGYVAIEFEQRVINEAALEAWNLAALFARHAGDRDLEQEAHDRGFAVHHAIYNNSALKQVTVPSSLQTPSWHQ